MIELRWMQLLRRLVGPVVVLHLWPIIREDHYARFFHQPYASWIPHLPRGWYLAVLWMGVVAGVAMTLRVRSRTASIVAFGVVVYHLSLSTTHFHNNRAYLAIVLGALALTTTAPVGPAWTRDLLRVEASVVYGASGFSKLLDADWWSGTVTHLRVLRVEERLLSETPLPGWAVDVLTDRSFHTGAAKVVILTEVFIALGLWWWRTRPLALGVAVVFHLAIEASATVQVFSWLALAVLVIWLPLRRSERSSGRTAPWTSTDTTPTPLPDPAATSSGWS